LLFSILSALPLKISTIALFQLQIFMGKKVAFKTRTLDSGTLLHRSDSIKFHLEKGLYHSVLLKNNSYCEIILIQDIGNRLRSRCGFEVGNVAWKMD
jgi:hypothetical protein